MNTPVKEQDLSIKETMAHIGKAAKEAAEDFTWNHGWKIYFG